MLCYNLSYAPVLISWRYRIWVKVTLSWPCADMLTHILMVTVGCRSDQYQASLPPAFAGSTLLGLSPLPGNDSHHLLEEPGNLLYSGKQLWVNRFTTHADFLCWQMKQRDRCKCIAPGGLFCSHLYFCRYFCPFNTSMLWHQKIGRILSLSALPQTINLSTSPTVVPWVLKKGKGVEEEEFS